LHRQPLLVVLRSPEPLELVPQIKRLQSLAIRQVELAWSPHPQWVHQCQALQECFPDICFGAASICSLAALDATAAAGLRYAVSPVLDRHLVELAKVLGLALVPGVMTPSEVHQAREWGCPVVKLFPATTLGPDYWSRLAPPLGPLPFCIAAGGLAPADGIPWLEAGVDAVALGGSLAHAAQWEALATLVECLRHRGSQAL
jgi:2-dehydro-3-deoxyphosphogluconate aldolase/(4S)-4-hydroxy-2-oxoglutarate aldolase